MKDKRITKGWGIVDEKGTEFWDTDPVFKNDSVDFNDWLKLVFYPKKFFLYRYLKKAKKKKGKIVNLCLDPFRVLDVGCGTGGAAIDIKKMFGRDSEIVGLDVVKVQVEVAKEKAKQNGVIVEFEWYDGFQMPFSNKTFDAVYTSDVLGHVEDVPAWLGEISRILRPNGILAMFAESELGRHAYLRKWFLERGLNTDPHAKYHISLYSKQELQKMLDEAGFKIQKMYASVWLKFLAHPDEIYLAFEKAENFRLMKILMWLLYKLKELTRPVSTAACELYSFFEMLLVGKWIESQGYVILAKKK